ncbi:hypothetical protein [Vibrio sp. CUB2]|uniref:hypothetical protein n=1 Tax=Vibrio sp. CUB2 TaxID=2315233 RepID=UPI000B02F8E8|nr:hypothetical protein [Vibrio sp. CUB2]
MKKFELADAPKINVEEVIEKRRLSKAKLLKKKNKTSLTTRSQIIVKRMNLN